MIDERDRPRWEVVEMLKTFSSFPGCRVIVWSGGGKDYAEIWVRRLFLQPFVVECLSKPIGGNGIMPEKVDLCFDDEDVSFGLLNLKV